MECNKEYRLSYKSSSGTIPGSQDGSLNTWNMKYISVSAAITRTWQREKSFYKQTNTVLCNCGIIIM